MWNSFAWSWVVCFVLGALPDRLLAAPALSASDEVRRWVSAKFEGVNPEGRNEPGLVVLDSYGKLRRDAPNGAPLKVGATLYPHGLYAHAPSRILIRLPAPGARLTAAVGIDLNSGDVGGSVEFLVTVAGKDAFRSGLVLRDEPPRAFDVDLHGESTFILTVTDGGDHIYSDQGVWGDAKLTLQDGQELWLADLPTIEPGLLEFDTALPFSFQYGDRSFGELVKGWKEQRSKKKLDAARIEHSHLYTDPETGLEVNWRGIEYTDFPTIEWTLHFKNSGTKRTPVLSKVQALDTRFEQGRKGSCLLHHHRGTSIRPDDYEPLTTELLPGQSARFAPPDGRPLSRVFPYFNLEWAGQGVIAVVGWTGQWATEFERDAGMGVRLTAGQELTHFILEPGEEVRTPLIVLQFWRGDWIDSQNVWRRWMLAHNLPRVQGKLPEPIMPAVSGNQFEGLLCNEADEIRYLDRYAEEGIKLTHWWMDAGWYVNKGDWYSVGTWETDRKRFPRGLRFISDYVHARGLGLIVWFEPERATPGSWLATEHPDWILGGKKGGLVDLGNPEAWNWALNMVDSRLKEDGIDIYRQDFNLASPLSYWRANDAADRQGITEIRHVTAYLKLWDELLRRHPNLRIDSCAGGGHRDDLETLRRGLPLLRSDYILDPVANQGHTYGLALWVPYSGTGFIDFNPYLVRSMMGPGFTLSCDARRKDLDWNMLRRLTAQWAAVAPNFLGDFYPLTPYSLTNHVWMAWQFDRPEAGEGIVQAFRRDQSDFRAMDLRLRNLQPDANYRLSDFDTERVRTVTGRILMSQGFPIEIPKRPGAALIRYQRVEQGAPAAVQKSPE